jgi:hypothetical protein
MVETACAARSITRSDYRFSRRDVREATSWSDFQVWEANYQSRGDGGFEKSIAMPFPGIVSQIRFR